MILRRAYFNFHSSFSFTNMEVLDISEQYNFKIVASHANENIPHPATLHKTSYRSGKFEGTGTENCATCRPIIQTKLRLGMELQTNDLPEKMLLIFVCLELIRRNHTIDAKIDTIHQYAI